METDRKSLMQYMYAMVLVLLLTCSLGGMLGCSQHTSNEDAFSSESTSTLGSQVNDDFDDQANTSKETSNNVASSGSVKDATASQQVFNLENIPDYSGSPFVVLNNNVPTFSDVDLSAPAESYSARDSLGRCGVAQAIVSPATMPTEERGSIGMVRPTGWHTVRYDDLVDGKYLYNRCHLIGYQLTGENANEDNLITGTRYLNVDGMLPFENEVADYVHATGNRVLYRVTPIFVGNDLLARGVHMEARSVEDDGAGVQFNVFCYNVQPGVILDYATGESRREDGKPPSGTTHDASSTSVLPNTEASSAPSQEQTYILNTRSKKFHVPGCSSVKNMSERNKQTTTATRDELIAQGYSPCGNCNP